MRDQAYWEQWLRENGPRLKDDMETARDWYKAAGVDKGERRAFKAALRGLDADRDTGVPARGRRRKGHNVTGRRDTGRTETPYGARHGRRATTGGARGGGPTWEGRLRYTREGKLLFLPDVPDAPAVRIAGNDLGDALPKDRVLVRVEGRRGGAPPYGRIVRVVERGIRTFVGRYSPIGVRDFVRFRDREADLHVPVDIPGTLRPEAGDLVLAEVTEYPSRGVEGRAEMVRVLGKEHTMETIFLSVANARDLPVGFSADARREAEQIPSAVRTEGGRLRGEHEETVPRVDQRDLPFVTIDGEDARDFDDAVCIVRDEGGRMRLLVAIADVSHYVLPGSAIDRDAYARGTSVYFPDRAVPMLPPSLSEGICSLKPGVNRLTMTVEIPVTPQGRTGKPSFYPGIIRSRARLTYDRVHAFLAGTEGEAARAKIPEEVGPMLRDMEALAGRLTLARSARGSLDFDLPEAKVAVEDGMPSGVVAAPRWESHRLIEEFMLLANTAVAEFLSDRGYAFLFRIHEPPTEERMEEFEDTVARLLRRGSVTDRRDVASRLQAWAAAARGGKYERHVNMLLLRSLMLARYGPEELGHFGLALTRYTHFTSPIRRYPDLIVHRVLKAALGERRFGAYARDLEEKGADVGDHLSARERLATDCERDVEARAKALLMSKRTGETFPGVIASVVRAGFFVELEEVYVEGFVHVSTLRDDDYRFSSDRNEWIGSFRKRRYGLGDRVVVRVRRTDVERGEIDLAVVEKLPDTL